MEVQASNGYMPERCSFSSQHLFVYCTLYIKVKRNSSNTAVLQALNATGNACVSTNNTYNRAKQLSPNYSTSPDWSQAMRSTIQQYSLGHYFLEPLCLVHHTPLLKFRFLRENSATVSTCRTPLLAKESIILSEWESPRMSFPLPCMFKKHISVESFCSHKKINLKEVNIRWQEC